MIRTVEAKAQDKPNSERVRPRVITWKGIRMVRNHSFLHAVEEIKKFSANSELTRIGLIGDPDSGKSTLSEVLAHCIHEKNPIPYAVRIFYEEQLTNFKETLASLQPTNYILIFDDVSFLEASLNKRQIDIIKNSITKIRHLPGGQNVKIILIMNYHSVKALTPYLRQADFRFFTSVSSDTERDNMLKIMGNKYYNKIEEFQKRRRRGIVKGHFTYKIGPKEDFPYKFKDPFIPLLFWNNESLRDIISPTRQWLEPICSTCQSAIDPLMVSEIPTKQFIDESVDKFGPGIFLAAVKIKLFMNGLNTYSNKVVQALRYLDKALEKKMILLEDIAAECKLEITKTRLRKKLDGVLADEPSQPIQPSILSS